MNARERADEIMKETENMATSTMAPDVPNATPKKSMIELASEFERFETGDSKGNARKAAEMVMNQKPPDDESILGEAHTLIRGERNDDYGPAEEDFTRQGIMWSQILGAPVSPQQIAMCMIATKLCREVHRAKHDNRLDIIGYAALLDDIS